MLPENSLYFMAHLLSSAARRAWVEKALAGRHLQRTFVALLAEGVGRNIIADPSYARCIVALLAEGVGRNFTTSVFSST